MLPVALDPPAPSPPEESFVTQNKAAFSARGFDVEIAVKQERTHASTDGDKKAVSLSAAYKVDEGKKDVGPGKASAGLKFGSELTLYGTKVHVRAAIPVRNGALDDSLVFVIDGFEALSIGLFGGAENGLADNTKVRIEVPVELSMPLSPAVTGGVPMVVQFKFKFLVTTAFSSKNSSLGASGRYRLTGPIGYQAGELLVPRFAVVRSLMDSFRGVSIAPNGLVFAGEFRFMVGFGIEEMMAGPYYKVTTALGVTLGSSVGLIQCRGATLKIDGGFGVGVQLSHDLTGALARILGKELKVNTDIIEVSKTIVNSNVTLPRVPLCGG
jgi:hypothetical protein